MSDYSFPKMSFAHAVFKVFHGQSEMAVRRLGATYSCLYNGRISHT